MRYSEGQLLNFIIDNKSALKTLIIDGDVIHLNSEQDINIFIEALDAQFSNWAKTGKESGKIIEKSYI
jgi:hypothetical protein